MAFEPGNPSATPPMRWAGKGFGFDFPRPAMVMGVLNVTPDSFSDGGHFTDVSRAIEHSRQMVADGAEIIDVGGESTRPDAEPVSEAEELRRVIPVIEALRNEPGMLVSIDTQKPAVAAAALAAGAVIVNDIAANRDDPAMWERVAEAGAGYLAMHMQGTPQSMQQGPQYGDVLAEVEAFFTERMKRFRTAGIHDEQIAFDVGIGFGKTLDHNLTLLAGLKRFTKFKRPQVLGVSRKSLFGKLLGLEVDERLAPGLACAVWAIGNGVQLLRVHDVKPTVNALRMAEAIFDRARE